MLRQFGHPGWSGPALGSGVRGEAAAAWGAAPSRVGLCVRGTCQLSSAEGLECPAPRTHKRLLSEPVQGPSRPHGRSPEQVAQDPSVLRAHGLQELQREWPRGLPGRAGPRGPGRGGGQSTVLLGAPCPGLLRCPSGSCPFWAGPRGAWPGCACPLQDLPCPPLRLVPSSSLSPGLGGLQTGPQATSTQIFVTHRCLGPPPGSRKPGWPAVWAPPAPRNSGATPTRPHPAGPTHARVRPVHSPSPQPPRWGEVPMHVGQLRHRPRSPRWELGWSAPSDSGALALGHWQPPQRAGGPAPR